MEKVTFQMSFPNRKRIPNLQECPPKMEKQKTRGFGDLTDLLFLYLSTVNQGRSKSMDFEAVGSQSNSASQYRNVPKLNPYVNQHAGAANVTLCLM